MENIRVEKQRTPLNTAPTYIPRRQNAEISEPIVSEPLIFVNQICTSSKLNRLVEMVSSNNAQGTELVKSDAFVQEGQRVVKYSSVKENSKESYAKEIGSDSCLIKGKSNEETNLEKSNDCDLTNGDDFSVNPLHKYK